MKKTLFAFMALAAAFLAVSCQSEEELPQQPTDPPTNGPMVTTGTAKAKINGRTIDVNWVQLWEGGPKFAEFNVGAANKKAEDYGGYYCWGSSIDKDSNAAYKSGTDALTGYSDTATNLWGINWRMPTSSELQALLNNCDVTWTDNYNSTGKKGRIYTGKGAYSSNSVFLPAAGRCSYGDVYGQGSIGSYWSSTPGGNGLAYRLDFNSGIQYVNSNRCSGGDSVRAVLAEE